MADGQRGQLAGGVDLVERGRSPGRADRCSDSPPGKPERGAGAHPGRVTARDRRARLSANSAPLPLAAVGLAQPRVEPRLSPIRAPTISAVSRARLRSEDHSERIGSALGRDRARPARAPARARCRSAACRESPGSADRLEVVVGLAVAGEQHALQRGAHRSPGGAVTAHRCRACPSAARAASSRATSTSLGSDVAEVDVGAEPAHEPHLLVLARRLEQDLARARSRGRSRRSGPPDLAVVAEDAGGAALARLGDHLPGAGLELGARSARPSGTAAMIAPVSSLEPTSDRTVNSCASRSISSSLRSCSSAIVPSEISKCSSPELVDPVDQLVEPVLGDRQLGERAAEHDRDPVLRGSASSLRLEVAGRERGAPAELDDVDVRRRRPRPGRRPRRPTARGRARGSCRAARLAAPLREVEQIRHRRRGLLRGVTWPGRRVAADGHDDRRRAGPRGGGHATAWVVGVDRLDRRRCRASATSATGSRIALAPGM